MKVFLLVILPTIFVRAALPTQSEKPKVILLDSAPKPSELLPPSTETAGPLAAKIEVQKTKPVTDKVINLDKLDPVPRDSVSAGPQTQLGVDQGSNTFTCNQKLLNGFGLNGVPEATVEPHKHCPAIKRNCCTSTDEDLSMDFWKTRDHLNVDRFYRAYSLMISYLLGYAKEGTGLSLKFKTASGVCGQAATDFEDLNTSRVLIEKILGEFKRSIRAMATLRTGFYCNLCDYTTQTFIRANTADFNSGSVQISKATCQTIVEETVPASYYSVTYLKRLLESLGTLINCESGTNEKMTFEVNPEEVRAVTKCFEAKDKFAVTACESYCGAVKLTEPVPLMDGFVDQLYKFFIKFQQSKKKVFQHPDLNVFIVSPDFEESAINSDMEQLMVKKEFFKALGLGQVDMKKFVTSVIEFGGADLWENMRGRTYYSYLAGAGVLRAVAAVLLWFWLI